MNELQIRVIETKPAVVNFNYQELSDYLDQTLSNYKSLIFTEETVSDCKKTIAELRKGQKSLDDFRKETKKKLTESVTAFENKCKLLYSKFDEVINPIAKQYEQFESDRKEAKRKEIQNIIDRLVQQHGLTEKSASRFIIRDDCLKKGEAIKDIETELAILAATMKMQQDKELQDIELIKTKVELINTTYQLSVGLGDGAYLSMLDYNRPVAEIVERITIDAEAIQKREQAYKESLKVETAPAAPVQQTPTPAPVQQRPAFTPVTLPTKPATVTKEVYEIQGTEAQMDALELFLNSNKYVWNYK